MLTSLSKGYCDIFLSLIPVGELSASYRLRLVSWHEARRQEHDGEGAGADEEDADERRPLLGAVRHDVVVFVVALGREALALVLEVTWLHYHFTDVTSITFTFFARLVRSRS